MTPTATVLTRLAGPTDAALLAQFAATRDDAAFAELVRRHGPAVFAVCRRLTRHAEDAEDAFQAAFLVLARKAERVREPAAAWLYGVAVRAARNAAARSWRRREREAPLDADVPAPAAESVDPDAAAAVIEEVGRLPEFLRSAVILCELDGRSRSAAARELGVAEGTLSSRLAAARKRLAARLAARGFGPAALAALAPAVVPARLTAATVPLARGAARPMMLPRFAAVAAVGVVAAVFAAERPRPAPQPAPSKAPPAGELVVTRSTAAWRLDPAGKKLGEYAPPKGMTFPGDVAVSPDGRWVALAAVPVFEAFPRTDKPFDMKLLLYPRAGGEPKGFDLPGFSVEPHWTPDGKSLMVARATNFARTTYTHALVHPATGTVGLLHDRPPGWINDAGLRVFAAHPKIAGYYAEHHDAAKKTAQLVLAVPPAVKLLPLTALSAPPGAVVARLSPDGKALLLVDGDPGRKDANRWRGSQRPYLYDPASGKREPLAGFPADGRAVGACWSPDGRRVAYTWMRLFPAEENDDPWRRTEWFVTTADADGRNPTTVATDTGRVNSPDVFRQVDWR